MSREKIKVISVVGPTASGKTELSVNIAKCFSGEVVSADSMQIYKGMDIATAKPSKEEMCGIVHHLMDYVDPDENYSVARFVADAKSAIESISSRHKIAVIAGGTGLYVDSLLNGIIFCEGETDLFVREELQRKLDSDGIQSLLDELATFDKESALKLSQEQNPKRIIRAIEIYRTTGITMTEQNILSKQNGSDFEAVQIGLKFRDREVLYQRINKRVDLMIKAGLVYEAQDCFSMPLSSTSKQAIGHKELKPYLDGEITLEECTENLKRATRRYAKRQLTWFNRNTDIHWFYVDDYDNSDELFSAVNNFLTEKGFEFNEK